MCIFPYLALVLLFHNLCVCHFENSNLKIGSSLYFLAVSLLALFDHFKLSPMVISEEDSPDFSH